jgi:hypothetical protein
MKAQRGSRIWLYSFFNLGCRWGWVVNATPRPGRFTPGKETRYQLYRRLGGLQGRSGRVRKISPPPGFDPRTVQPVASRYTDCAIETCRRIYCIYIFSNGATAPSRPGPPHCQGFTIIPNRHTTLGRTPLDEWSARRRDLCLTTHNTHKREICMLPAGFEPTIQARERPQTHALDRADTGIGYL